MVQTQNKVANLGELDAIARFDGWQFFGTLTFAQPVPGLVLSRKLVYAFLYKVPRVLHTPFPRLLWVLRVEHGEATGRLHYHFLLGGGNSANLGHCFTLNAMWDALPRCGHARIRLFDVSQNGAAYVASCLAAEGTAGANFYEAQKFGTQGSDVTLSNSLVRLVGGRRVDVDRLRGQECGKKRRQKRGIVQPRHWAFYKSGQFDWQKVYTGCDDVTESSSGIAPRKTSTGINSLATVA